MGAGASTPNGQKPAATNNGSNMGPNTGAISSPNIPNTATSPISGGRRRKRSQRRRHRGGSASGSEPTAAAVEKMTGGRRRRRSSRRN